MPEDTTLPDRKGVEAGTGVDFYAQSQWTGPVDGYCFRTGPRGTGMYLDVGLENRLLLEGAVGVGVDPREMTREQLSDVFFGL